MHAPETKTVPVSVVVLTRDEECNLEPCLSSVSEWASEVFVVDSGSTDATVEIAERFGAFVVQHAFETHAQQWSWAVSKLPLRYEWVLGIDADQRVTPELARSIRARLASEASKEVAGFYVARRQIFRGRWIRWGAYYPIWLLKLFRRDAVWFEEGELVDHHFYVRGRIARLEGDLVEENLNEASIAVWVDKHNRYARLQAQEEWLCERGEHRETIRPALFADPNARVLWRKRVYRRLPLFVRPTAYFLYRYVFRLGFLDGKQGFLFHFLQAFWYRLLVDVTLEELRQGPRGRAVPARRSFAAKEEERRFPRWLIGPVTLLGLLVPSAPLLVRSAGEFLVVEDPLEPASGIVILNGDVPFREEKAAEIYRRGFAPRLILVRGDGKRVDALRARDIDVREDWMLRHDVLVRSGVPPGAIALAEGRAESTKEELEIAARALEPTEGAVILVTSSYHGRRVRLLWDEVSGGRRKGVVRVAHVESFDARNWLGDRRAMKIVVHEYLGLIAYLMDLPW